MPKHRLGDCCVSAPATSFSDRIPVQKQKSQTRCTSKTIDGVDRISDKARIGKEDVVFYGSIVPLGVDGQVDQEL